MMRISVLLVALAALSGCDSPLLRPPPPSHGEQLTGDTLKSTLSGNSLVTSEEEVPPLVLYFSEQGELRGLRSNHYADEGAWRVEDDLVCGKWQNWFGTMASCWQVFRAGSVITAKNSAGTEIFRATLVPGNVASL